MRNLQSEEYSNAGGGSALQMVNYIPFQGNSSAGSEVAGLRENGGVRAAVLHQIADISQHPLSVEEAQIPSPRPGEVQLRVEACGVCRTDLHIVTGELPVRHTNIVPGHQIVGRVTAIGTDVSVQTAQLGQRVGVSWLGGADGTCDACRHGLENLCDTIAFTGYTRPGGYAEFTTARADFCIPLPPEPAAEQLAPLLCAGIIGFRALRVAQVEPGQRVGLYGFGASAHLAIEVLKHWGCEIYVATRGTSHQAFARSLGAKWVGEATERPPVALDRAVTFAPSGDVVIAALGSLRKGGIVAINAIHLDRMPEFEYDTLLWGERQIRSVANMTRQDARDFVALALEIGIRPRTTVFELADVNLALNAVARDAVDGAAVVRCE